MSDKIKKQLDGNEKTFIISPYELRYVQSIEQIKTSMNYYLSQVQSEYLKLLSLNLGYLPEQDLEFSIDLGATTGELKIKEVPKPSEDLMLDKDKEA